MTPSVDGHTIYHNTVQEATVSLLPFFYRMDIHRCIRGGSEYDIRIRYLMIAKGSLLQSEG